MSNQADVRSVDAIKDFRVALALFAEDALGALGTVNMEAKRTIQWVQHDRRAYWAEQIKRRQEQVALAKAEVFRRKLAKTDDYTPAMSEQKEKLRIAEARLEDAERRAVLVKKWETALQQAVFEYQGASRRMSSLVGGDVPRAIAVLERMIGTLEAYLDVSAPTSGPSETSASATPVGTIVEPIMTEDEAEPLSSDEPTMAPGAAKAEPSEGHEAVGTTPP
jgi:hypothetical protein